MTVWALAFRPLFLLGTLFSLLAIAWWGYFWWSPFSWQPYGGPLWWHGHEMLFGFVAAIVLGFLLTAVRNWTGVTGLSGLPLIALVFSWFSGRLLVLFGAGLPVQIVIVGDCLFLLLGAMAMAWPIIKVRQWRNIIFIPVLLTLAALNGYSHWAQLNDRPLQASSAFHAAIMLFVLIVTIIGGRVIPLFSANKMGFAKPVDKFWLELFSVAPLLGLVVAAAYGFGQVPPELLVPLCVVAAIAQFLRFSRWGILRCLSEPLLWSLHLSYLFVPLGLLALALNSAGILTSNSAALHCFTVGAMGSMILAMVSRVSLGHTGRPLQPPKGMALAFVFILLSAVLRGLVPLALPDWSYWGIILASIAWVFAYTLFVFRYSAMLLSPRVDGRPG